MKLSVRNPKPSLQARGKPEEALREVRTLIGLWCGLPNDLPPSEREQADSRMKEAGSILQRLDPETPASILRRSGIPPGGGERGPSVDPSQTSEIPATSESPNLPTEDEIESVSAHLNTTHIGTQPTRRAKSRKE